ncbi:MAG: asparaginase [Candidatus Omnitrophica bacterium]|nr:asparaginase [Candidatus Omnitrophota bacterium]
MKYSSLIVCCVVFCTFFAASSYADLPKVVIVATGGTIAEKTDPKTGGAVPAVSGKDLIEAVPGLGKIANIEVVNLCDIDSSQMTPEIWARLSKTVDERLAEAGVKGVVVTHGTDTMAEGAYFLSLTLKSDKPVAFVGAMRDVSDVSPDGPANILNAVIQVCSEEAKDWGVTVTLNEYINSARNVVKTNSTNVQTFDSGEKGYLGYIAMGKVIHYNDAPARQRLPIPDKLPDVIFLSTFAGDDGSLVRFAVDRGAKGIVIDAVGAGNVNAKVYEAVKYAIAKGVVVVITTSVYHSGVWPMYGDQGGGETLEKNGAILGGDLPGAKARLLLMLAIAKEKGNVDEIKKYFKR